MAYFERMLLLLFVLSGLFSLSPAETDTFDEELMIKPLSNGYVYAYFQFTTLWKAPNNIETRMLSNASIPLLINNQSFQNLQFHSYF
jgi:hypothetical protein